MHCVESNDSPNIRTLRINTIKGPASFVSTYALTVAASTEEKEEFYDKLQKLLILKSAFKLELIPLHSIDIYGHNTANTNCNHNTVTKNK